MLGAQRGCWYWVSAAIDSAEQGFCFFVLWSILDWVNLDSRRLLDCFRVFAQIAVTIDGVSTQMYRVSLRLKGIRK
jgi:hypothetical protein